MDKYRQGAWHMHVNMDTRMLPMLLAFTSEQTSRLQFVYKVYQQIIYNCVTLLQLVNRLW